MTEPLNLSSAVDFGPERTFPRARSVVLPDGTVSPPPPHVVLGARAIVHNRKLLLGDEMGAMKTAQAIIAAQALWEEGTISNVVVLAPASVRPVWYSPDFGELPRHLWVPANVVEFHSSPRAWEHKADPLPEGHPRRDELMLWFVSNYEYVRSAEKLEELLEACGPQTLLILDESAMVKSSDSLQFKAAEKMRGRCGRILEMNGTPVPHSPMDVYAQARLLDPAILGCKTKFHFRGRYGVMGGWNAKQIVGWRNLEDLQRRMAPYVLRRMTRDCVDLPPALPPVTMEKALEPPTWRAYREMRDDLVAWLDSQTVAVASQAAVKALRLSQITSGFVGGVEESEGDLDALGDAAEPVQASPREIGREKLDAFLEWLARLSFAEPDLKLVVLCRFRPELARLVREVRSLAFNGVIPVVGALHGGQSRDERDAALKILNPATASPGPAIVCATYGTGSLGVNLTAAHTMFSTSFDHSLMKHLQSVKRIDRPGQTQACRYYELLATGPKGEKTVDHAIAAARKAHEDVATWTVAAWRRALAG